MMTFLGLLHRLFAFLSIVLLVAAAYFLWSWADWRDALGAGLAPWRDTTSQDWRLYVALGVLAWSLLGAIPMRLLLGRAAGSGHRLERAPGSAVTTADGSILHVERDGPPDAPVLVFTHGWGMDATTWIDARRRLAERYHLIFWDLPGLGRSKGPRDGKYTLDGFADALAAIVELAGRRQVILVGHSIGGMIIQTFARRHPARMGDQVRAVVLEHTTHTNPLQTTFLSSILRPLQPFLETLMRLDVWLSPLVWLMNWQSYLSGSTHLAMRLSGFGVRPPRDLLEQVSLLATRNSPAVQAKGNLAMMRWDATGDLQHLSAPTLVFTGGRDLVTRATAGETIARRAPAARLHHVEVAGHMGPQECADLYNAVITKFADDVFTQGIRFADRPCLETDENMAAESPPHFLARDPDTAERSSSR
jgi:pimeloyl-ACP methyl ester carboxylesterase